MSETRTFHAGTILSVLTPHMVSPGGPDAIGALLAFMAGEELDPHQWRRVAAESKTSLSAQHPDLATLSIPPAALASREAGLAWLASLPDSEARAVTPLASEDHTHIDPAAEALAKYGVPFRSALRGGT
jgi:hypothetical protein